MNKDNSIIISRRSLYQKYPPPQASYAMEAEGGCGVTGFAVSIPVGGRHILEPSIQMHNRGNGKGGGIAAVGLSAEDLGVSEHILRDDYIIQVALLDTNVEKEVLKKFFAPYMQVDYRVSVPKIDDWRDLEGLSQKPPDVIRYHVRVKHDALKKFVKNNGLENLSERAAEDEFIYRNSYALNQTYYASLGEKMAFVLSHGRNQIVLKIVGYAEDIVRYYKMENFRAHIWIAHQRYPTKGRVWHPGGAHPFVGLNEALVHNGDFANYYSVCEYLRQRNIYPLFLTDTEVSVQLFDLWNRVYGYPLEYIIEALAPTSELDLDRLPKDKRELYKLIQATHMHGSPDGPWFFIIARNLPDEGKIQLLGITDTSMLRPQVFALLEGEREKNELPEVRAGFICSEKQAIDATLKSLAREDSRFITVADRYWNARGGSHTDGGSFMFTLKKNGNGSYGNLTSTDKFGRIIHADSLKKHFTREIEVKTLENDLLQALDIDSKLRDEQSIELYRSVVENLEEWDFNTFRYFLNEVVRLADSNDIMRFTAVETLTLLIDRRYPTGTKKRASLLHLLHEALNNIFENIPLLSTDKGSQMVRIDRENSEKLRTPQSNEKMLVINASLFPPEGDDCIGVFLRNAYELNWQLLIVYGCHGQRFIGSGLGPDTKNVRIDVYGSSGDYLGSGLDGLELYVHGNAQDQLGQILRDGKLVIFGDVGQTFLYGAKGGEIYVMGNAAGRPLVNAVGKPRAVINGTCLDYLAESFMAGDPLRGGGFVILNGLEFDDEGKPTPLDMPYPGSNLFSLASGGAIYIRDPHNLVVEEQLNSGEFAPMTPEDWNLIQPYLIENERLFGISIEHDLLTSDGEKRPFNEIYRKIKAVKLAALIQIDNGD